MPNSYSQLESQSPQYDASTYTFTLYDISPEMKWDPCDDIYCIPINNNIDVVDKQLFLGGKRVNYSDHVDRIVFVFKEKPSRNDIKTFITDLYEAMQHIRKRHYDI